MHEFSIVSGIIEIVTDSALKHNVQHVTMVEIEAGEASGVVKEAMDFAWEAAKKGTILENAQLKIISVPIRAQCKKCLTVFQASAVFDVCPSCKEMNPDIISGRELRVISIEA